MSAFFSKRHGGLVPYVPGEQPQNGCAIKLNTNESPFPPSNPVIEAIQAESGKLMLYSDPDCASVVNALARRYGVNEKRVIVSNGSDEVLNFAFAAFGDESNPFVFPDVTYGFYPVFAAVNGVPYETLPLKSDFTLSADGYCGINKNIVIANPNAPTGLAIGLADIEKIVKTNPNNVVIIDEAYVDFGAQSAVRLTDRYNNLLVVQTFSKSRSLAGARLGFGIACEELIRDLNTIRFSTNPYNVNRMTMAAGAAALSDDGYYMNNCRVIAGIRDETQKKLQEIGFEVTDSKANFMFIKSNEIGGQQLYIKLKEKGILVRHFNLPRIEEYNRVTVGTETQMGIFIEAIRDILKENKL